MSRSRAPRRATDSRCSFARSATTRTSAGCENASKGDPVGKRRMLLMLRPNPLFCAGSRSVPTVIPLNLDLSNKINVLGGLMGGVKVRRVFAAR